MVDENEQLAENQQEKNSQEVLPKKVEEAAMADNVALGPRKSVGNYGWIISIAVVLIAIVVGFQGWQQLSHTVREQKLVISYLKGSMTQTQGNLSTQRQLLTTQQQELQAQRQHLTQQQESIGQLERKTAQDERSWLVAEVNYLVQLAAFSLHFQHDSVTAIGLLQRADQSLNRLADPQFVTLKTVLQNDIKVLKDVEQPNIEDILSKIAALSQQIKKLIPVTPLTKKEQQERTESQTPENPSRWRRAMHTTWQKLENVVVIRHHEDVADPLLLAAGRGYLDEHLQLLLVQTQWAVLNRREKLYQVSLSEATQWVDKVYAQDSENTKAMLVALKSLQQKNINPKLPTISASIDAIQSMNKTSLEGTRLSLPYLGNLELEKKQ